MPGLSRGKDGQVGVTIITPTADNSGAGERRHVPAVIPLTSPYPLAADGSDATPVAAGSGNVANASAVATIPAVANKTAYITGFDLTGAGATAALIVNPTLAGIISGTRTYVYGAVAGAALMNQNLSIRFHPAIPASAVNTAITLTCPALGAGNLFNAAHAYGYYI
jgi:hypothetical protein